MGCFCFSHDFNKSSVEAPARVKQKPHEKPRSIPSHPSLPSHASSYRRSSDILTSRGCDTAPNFGHEGPSFYQKGRDLADLLIESQTATIQREMRRLNDAQIDMELQRYEEEQARLDCLHRAEIDALQCGGWAHGTAGLLRI